MRKKNLIVELIASEPANKVYIDSTIDMYYSAPSENDSAEDFNSFLKSSLTELNNFGFKQDEILENEIEFSENLPQSRVIAPYPTAIAAYRAGIALVD